MLRRKMAQYTDYFDEKIWQEKTDHSDPALLFVCPSETIKGFLHKHIAQVLEEEAEENIDFYLTTKEILKNGQPENNIWEKVEEG